tara:strand:+ start:803 stop:3607 length:2805 start_codon:yes stop_codon:yes gene_type:complete
MTLKTSLIITGDSKSGQAAVDDLKNSVDRLNTSTKGAVAPTQQLDNVIGRIGPSAATASGATNNLNGALVNTGRVAGIAAAAQGAVATASTVATGAMTAFGVSAATVEAILTGGLSLVLTAVGTLLGGIAVSALEGADAFGEQESAAASLAEEQKALNGALAKSIDTQYAMQIATLATAEALRQQAIRAVEARKALIENAIVEQKSRVERSRAGGDRSDVAAMGLSGAQGQIADLKAQLAKAESDLAKKNKDVSIARRPFVERGIQAAVDPRERANLRYDQQRYSLDLRREKGLGDTQYARERAKLDRDRAAALETLSKSEEKATGTTRKLGAARSSVGAIDRQATKDAREADAENKRLDATYNGLINKYDKAAASARDYAGTLQDISDLLASGRLNDMQARQFVVRVTSEAITNDLSGSLANKGDFSKELEAAAEAAGAPLIDAGEQAGDALRQGAQNVYDLLGRGKLGGAISSLLQDLGLKGNDPSKNLAGQIKKLGDNILGPELSGSIGKAVGGVFQGAANGQFASSIADKVGIKQSKTGAAIGGALGQFGFGPIGGFVGGLIGGTLGGLLKKAKTGSATITSATGEVTTSGNNSARKQQSTELAGSVQDGLKQIAEQLGGTADGAFKVSIGMYKDDYRVDTTGSGRTKGYTSSNSKNEARGLFNFKDDAQGAVAFALADAVSDGAINGLSAAVTKALTSDSDVEAALKEALKVQEVETLLGGIGSAMALQFRDLERQAKERVRIAQQYGFDVAAIEKKNAEDRLKLNEQLLEEQVGSLQRLVKEMTSGSLFEGSAVDQRTALQAEIAKAKADLDAGKEGAGNTLASLYEQLASVSKDVFGTTGGFAADRAQILNEAQAAIAKSNAQIEAASKSRSDPALTQTNKALDENNDQNAQMLALMQGLPAEIARYMVGGGSTRINLSALARTQER